MKKKLGILLAAVLTFCMSATVFADAGKTQQVDYKTDYYMIVESPDGGVDMYSEASADSPKLNDELMKYEPSEIVCNEAFLVSGFDVDNLKTKYHISVNALEPHICDDE